VEGYGGGERLRRWEALRRWGGGAGTRSWRHRTTQLVSRRLGNAGYSTGFGVGALTSLVSSLTASSYGYGYGYRLWCGCVGSTIFPDVGHDDFAVGIGPGANTWLFSNYTNPYYATSSPPSGAGDRRYDYSRRSTWRVRPDPSVAPDRAVSRRGDAFKAGDYQRGSIWRTTF